MYRKLRSFNNTSVDITDALMSQTHTKDGNLPPEIAYNIIGYTGFQRGAGTGRDNDMAWCHNLNLFQRNGIITIGYRLLTKLAEVLNKILDDIYWKKKIQEDRLKELLGHTPIEVLTGVAIGVFMSLLCYRG